MAAVHEDEVGFEEGMLWCLPSNVLDEACHTKVSTRHRLRNHQQLRHHKSSVEPQHSKCSSRSHQRPKLPNGGSGMQAIFLESRQGSCGTGVFLPQTAGTNFQPRRKPACASVLLPNRVIRALNLNVHTLGLQISPRQDPKHKPRCGDVFSKSSKKGYDEKDVSKQYGVIPHSQSLCPAGIFLPKDWTY